MNISVAFTWDLYCFTSIHKKCCCPQGIYGFNISGSPTSAGHHKAKQKPSTPEIQNSHSSPAHDLLPGLGVLSVNLKREKRANNRRKCYFVFRSDRILIKPNFLSSVQIAQDEPQLSDPDRIIMNIVSTNIIILYVINHDIIIPVIIISWVIIQVSSSNYCNSRCCHPGVESQDLSILFRSLAVSEDKLCEVH